jgi:hypothetical protein
VITVRGGDIGITTDHTLTFDHRDAGSGGTRLQHPGQTTIRLHKRVKLSITYLE